MRMKIYHMMQQTQDFLLRLFVGADFSSVSSDSSYYTCARCGTHARLYH